MATVCPKDGKGCVDDLCRGSGVCGVTGQDMWDRCSRCHGVYSDEIGVDCACEAGDEDDDEGPEDWDSYFDRTPHDPECEAELTSHGRTPCRCGERAGVELP